jgi:hypothetical protein
VHPDGVNWQGEERNINFVIIHIFIVVETLGIHEIPHWTSNVSQLTEKRRQ